MLDFSKIQQKLLKYTEDENALNEENTKMTLVAPFIAQLGFDVFDIDDVICEYTSDMRENGNEKVDYAIMLDSQPKIFIEVKALGTKLIKHIGQLKRYYVSSKTVKWGILTDGDSYMFFNDSEITNIMDDEPFYMLKISELCDKDIELLNLFAKNKLREDVKIDSFRINTKLTRFLNNSILKPDEDFLEYINTRIGERLNKSQYMGILNDVLKSYSKSYVEDNDVDKLETDNFMEQDNIDKDENETKNILRKISKKPKGYEIFGEYYEFTSWKDILTNTLNYIIDLDLGMFNKVRESITSKACCIYSVANEYRSYFENTTNKDIVYSLSKSDEYIMGINTELNNGYRVYTCAGSKDILKISTIAITLTELDTEVKLIY